MCSQDGHFLAHFDMSGFAKIFLGSGIPIYKPSFADILDWVVDPMTVIPAEFPGHWLADIFFST